MRDLGRRCALPLAVALLLLGCAACGSGNVENGTANIREPSVDSSDTRAHLLGRLLRRTDTLSTFSRALRQAGLARDLDEDGPFTLFAPTDRAVAQYWPGFDSLLAPNGATAAGATDDRASPAATRTPRGTPAQEVPDLDSLRQVLRFHLVRGRFGERNFSDSLRMATLADESLLIERARQNRNQLRIRVKGTPRAIPIRRTLEAQNGVLHIVGRPLRIPPPDTSATDTTLVPTTQTASGGN